jgi:hypothetical protein
MLGYALIVEPRLDLFVETILELSLNPALLPHITLAYAHAEPRFPVRVADVAGYGGHMTTVIRKLGAQGQRRRATVGFPGLTGAAGDAFDFDFAADDFSCGCSRVANDSTRTCGGVRFCAAERPVDALGAGAADSFCAAPFDAAAPERAGFGSDTANATVIGRFAAPVGFPGLAGVLGELLE